MTLADNLVARRLDLGWRQIDLARKSGVSRSAIASIEAHARPNPQLYTVLALARALDTTVEELAADGWPQWQRDLEYEARELRAVAG